MCFICVSRTNAYKSVYYDASTDILPLLCMHTITAHKLDQDQDLLTELRILSSLRPHDRISTNNSTKPVIRIQKPNVFQPLVRFFGSESRISNVAYIQSLLQRIIDRHTFAVQIKDDELAKRLKAETQNAIRGIRRLQHTYEDDAQFQAAMNISIDTVCIHLDIQALEMQPMMPKVPAQDASDSTEQSDSDDEQEQTF